MFFLLCFKRRKAHAHHLHHFRFAKASAIAAVKAAKLAEVAGNSVTIPSHFPGDNGQNVQAQDNQVQPQPPDSRATPHPGIQASRAKIPILGDDSYIDNYLQDNPVQPQPPDGRATPQAGIQESKAKIPILGDNSYIDNYLLNRNIAQPMHHDWHREFGIDERQRNGHGEVDPVTAEWAQLPRRVTSFSCSSEAVSPTPSSHRALSQRSAVNLSPGLTAGLYPGVVVASNMSYTSADPPSRISSPLPRMSTPSSPE